MVSAESAEAEGDRSSSREPCTSSMGAPNVRARALRPCRDLCRGGRYTRHDRGVQSSQQLLGRIFPPGFRLLEIRACPPLGDLLYSSIRARMAQKARGGRARGPHHKKGSRQTC